MRCVILAVAALVASLGVAEAKIAITVNKDLQQMTVAVDGVTKYTWPVSSGNPTHETPNGSFQTFRMEEDHYSKEFDDAPMPHAIFFTKQGHAIHGTDSVSRLGSPASHGCVRLSRANAATLFAMVQADGVLNTTVTLTGSSRVALARNPGAQVARRDEIVSYDSYGNPITMSPDAARPIYQVTPRRLIPQGNGPLVAGDGYMYRADGGGGRYLEPRGYRRGYDSQGNPQYDVDRGGYAPRGYYQRSYVYPN